MYIRSVSIVNYTRGGASKATLVGGAAYEMLVVLNFIPGEEWKRYFRHRWLRNRYANRKNYVFSSNELRVQIEKDEDIQSYIELTQQIIKEISEQLSVQNTSYDPDFYIEDKVVEFRNMDRAYRSFHPASFDV